MSKIETILARRVWDSRGNPTIEAEVILASGKRGRAIAPAGASRGKREAIDLRDGGAKLRGMDVQKALRNIRELIAPALLGRDVDAQSEIDGLMIELDGTENKSRLGGNAIVAVSLAVIHAAAAEHNRPLWAHIAKMSQSEPSIPQAEIQIFGGGAHADKRVDIQDFMVMTPHAESFAQSLEMIGEIYHAAGARMKSQGLSAGVADEGGWWPNFANNVDAIETLTRAIEDAGFKAGHDAVISLDIAASEFFEDGHYVLGLENRKISRKKWLDTLASWLDDYPIFSVEDPFAEDDDEGMKAFTQKFGNKVQIIGDDYLVTNSALIERAAKEGICNAALIKLNQIGTVSETLDAIRAAKSHDWGSIVSARSGETEDLSICHLAVGSDAGQFKVGSFSRSERMAKWNEILRIEEQLGTDRFVGNAPFALENRKRN